mmetsp:Transcript_38533/g.77172  ORF Transcript_38533/g.77172 Transcript_38533/m.77172 type:complete len:343 (-) Transcript_38533:1397-2425(-)
MRCSSCSRALASLSEAAPLGASPTPACTAAWMAAWMAGMSVPCAAASIACCALSRASRIAFALFLAAIPRLPACITIATLAIFSVRFVLRASSTPRERKTRSLPILYLPSGISILSSTTRHLSRAGRGSLCGTPAISPNMLEKSANTMRSGKPVRATRSASSTPDVCSWRETTSSSQESAAFESLGLKQRTKWSCDEESTLLSAVSCVRKVSTTPLNLFDLNLAPLPPAGGAVESSVKRSRSTRLSENCISTTRSPLSGSLFLLSQSLVLYVTEPAKCVIWKPSERCRPLTCERGEPFFWASWSFSVKPLSEPLGTMHSSASRLKRPVLGTSNMASSSLLSV